MIAAPPRRFCHAACLAMPARNREKMNDARASPAATASCQPAAPPVEKLRTSELGSS